MWRCAALAAVALALIFYLQPSRFALASLKNHILICTVCSRGEEVPTAPITFAARFYDKTFTTQAAPLVEEESKPGPQGGQYIYKRTSSRRAALRLRQADRGVHSTLHLLFSHGSGGTLYGEIWQDDELVARQYGSFHLCSMDV